MLAALSYTLNIEISELSVSKKILSVFICLIRFCNFLSVKSCEPKDI